QEAALNQRVWGFSGGGAYFSLTRAGLTMDGGSGGDGLAALVGTEDGEAGGTMLLEAVGVNLSPGSTGMVAAVYSSGLVQAGNCVAGFQATAAAGTGTVSIAPFVQGSVAG